MKRLSLVVPCYNEKNNIGLILSRFDEVIDRADLEILLVDNGSTDGSKEVFRTLISGYPFARLVEVPKNQGYGFGILSGLRVAEGQFLGWTHADMQTDPQDVLRALNILEGRDYPRDVYVKGERRGRPAFDQLFTTGMSIFESVYLGERLHDINAQPNLFHRSFFETWKNPPHDFSLDLYALYLAKRQGLDLVRFPVLFPERLHGESKWNTSVGAKWRFIKRTLNFSTQLKRQLVQEPV